MKCPYCGFDSPVQRCTHCKAFIPAEEPKEEPKAEPEKVRRKKDKE